jgi:hypothetical protein
VWDKLVLEFNQSNISTQTLYWEDFYMQLEKSNKAETLFCEFFNLLKNWFGIEPVQFSGKELDDMERKDMGNFIAKVNQVIDNVYSIMHKEDYKLRRNNQETSYGFDISREGKELGWFGVWYRIWAEQGDVLILKTNTDMSLDNKELKTTRNKTEYFSLDDFLQSDETDTNIAKYLLQKFNEMK